MKFKTEVVRDAALYLVRWVDSQGDTSGWTYFNSNDITENQMESVGYIVENDDEKVSVVPHIGFDAAGFPKQMLGRIVIPQKQISAIIKLKEDTQ